LLLRRSRGRAADRRLLERFWWGAVFPPALPVMGRLLVVGPRLLPE
jgi:hypothetical protein